MKILVVHRQKETVDQIKSLLSSCNPVVLHAVTGLDGLLTSRVERFDLIICGTDLPVVTGFELVRSIRTNSVNRDTTVIFLSDIHSRVNHNTVHQEALSLTRDPAPRSGFDDGLRAKPAPRKIADARLASRSTLNMG